MYHDIPVTCNSKLPRCYTKMAIMAEQLIHGMWPTIPHLLPMKQHSMMRFVHTPYIGTKRNPLTKEGSQNILVHVVAMYDAFQAVLGFSCRHVLHLPDVHALTCLPRITECYEDIRKTSLLGVHSLLSA